MQKKERPYGYDLWWNPFFNYQHQTNRILKTMLPEPFATSLQNIEENIIAPMQENIERLSAAILSSNKMLLPFWYEEYAENSGDNDNTKDKEKQKKAA